MVPGGWSRRRLPETRVALSMKATGKVGWVGGQHLGEYRSKIVRGCLRESEDEKLAKNYVTEE